MDNHQSQLHLRLVKKVVYSLFFFVFAKGREGMGEKDVTLLYKPREQTDSPAIFSIFVLLFISAVSHFLIIW